MATTKQIINTAEKLDKILFEKPTLNLDADVEKLKLQIVKDACQLVPDDEKELDKEMEQVLTELLEQHPDEVNKYKDEYKDNLIKLGLLPEDRKPEEGGVEEDDDTDDEIAEELSLKEEVEQADRIKELKEIAKSNDEFKSIRGKLNGYRNQEILRSDMLSILDGKLEKKIEDGVPKQIKSKPKTKVTPSVQVSHSSVIKGMTIGSKVRFVPAANSKKVTDKGKSIAGEVKQIYISKRLNQEAVRIKTKIGTFYKISKSVELV